MRFLINLKKGSRTISRVMSPRDFYTWTRRSGRLPRRPCHLSNRCLALLRHSSSLPPGYGRAAHCDTSLLRKLFCHAPVYMALQPIRRAACRVTTTSGGLLPHLFTIAPVTRKWLRLLFSVTLLCRHRQLTVREYGALCCPDFPLAAPEINLHQQATQASCYRRQRYK